MLELDTKFGTHAHKRLTEAGVIWFTCVSSKGRPSTNPVWFFWDGELIFVYSQPESFRVRYIKNNPRVVLNLEGVTVMGENVLVINGLARLYPGCTKLLPAYAEKYRQYQGSLSTNIEEMIRDYSVEIRVTPLKFRAE